MEKNMEKMYDELKQASEANLVDIIKKLTGGYIIEGTLISNLDLFISNDHTDDEINKMEETLEIYFKGYSSTVRNVMEKFISDIKNKKQITSLSLIKSVVLTYLEEYNKSVPDNNFDILEENSNDITELEI